MTDNAQAVPPNAPTATQTNTPLPVTMGWILIAVGMFAVVMAFLYDVGVDVGTGSLYSLPERVVNSDKLAFRSMVLDTGLASFVAGWIALSAGLILEAIDRK